MKKMIRLSGLAAFVAIIGGLATGAYFFAEPLIEISIEKAGTAAVGAKVDVGSVDLQWQAAGIRLNRVEVTDADQPMQNLFKFAQATASLELLKALMGQVIINELSMQGLEFGTARTSSGAIAKVPEKVADKTTGKAGDSSFLSEQFDQLTEVLPDTKELLSRQPLLTEQRKQELDAIAKERQAQWQEIQQQLPTKDSFRQYDKDFKSITSGKITSVDDFKQRQTKLKALKKSIKAERDQLLAARDFVKASQSDITAAIKALKAAPKQDWALLKSKYSFDQGGALNISGLLFGNQFAYYSSEALGWYNKLKPYVGAVSSATEEEPTPPRGEGRFIRFPETNPQPDFIIKQAMVQAELARGPVQATITDITHQQAIIGRPTVLALQSQALKDVKDFSLNAIFDHRGEQAKESANFKIQHLQLSDIELSDSKKLALTMDSAQVDISGAVQFTEGQLSGEVDSVFSAAQLNGTGGSSLANEIALALADIHDFSMAAALTGSLKDVDVDISSNLDQRLKAAFSKRLKAKQKEWEAKIKKGLEDKLNAYIAEDEKLAQFFNQEEGDLEDKINNIDELLKAELTNYMEQQKAAAKAKLEQSKQAAKAKAEAEKQKAKAKLAAEKKKAKARVDAEKEKRKKEAEDKLKDKFKKLF